MIWKLVNLKRTITALRSLTISMCSPFRVAPTASLKAVNGDKIFKIGLVADQDENSLVNQKTWNSWLKTGTLTLHYDGTVTVKWDTDKTELQTHVSEKGRGAELSELIVFNGKLYTVDDRTGIGEMFGFTCLRSSHSHAFQEGGS